MAILKQTEAGPDTPDLSRYNRLLADKTPSAIAQWALLHAERPIITTNFRPLSVALLHIVTSIKPELPVLWIDTGYNTEATYEFVEKVQKSVPLNLHVYRPHPDPASPLGRAKIPDVGTPEHGRFTQRVKLEPFARALAEWTPDYWLTGIRHDQTSYRRTLDTVSAGPRNVLRVAPLLRWSEADVDGYIYEQQLPDYDDYFDPTKGNSHRECGLQTLT